MIVIMSLELSDQFANGSSRKLDVGEYLFHRDDPVEWMHIVESGEVRLVRYQQNGNAVILQRAHSGAFAAEASLFSARYHCDAVAATPSVVKAVEKSKFVEKLQTDPNLANLWSKRLAQEVQRARLRSEIAALKTVAQRLDAWLTWNDTLPEKGEWRALAFEIAVSPEALYRELSNRRTRT